MNDNSRITHDHSRTTKRSMNHDETGAWQVITVGTVDSTNGLAAEWVRDRLARNEQAGGVAVVAERQRAGRGQHGRVWESPPGGMYLSAAVDGLPAEMRDRLPLVAGVAAVRALRDVGISGAGIRWPNDVMIGGKKVGGILCEGVALGDRFAAIVGMGINVTTALDALPERVRDRATSLLEADGVRREVKAVVAAVLGRLGEAIDAARREGLDGIMAVARGMDVLRGQVVVVALDGVEISGVGAGISEKGELLLKLKDGARSLKVGTVMSVAGVEVRG